MSSKYEPEEYIDQLHKELDECKAENDKLKEDYAQLQKSLCGTNAELSNAWRTTEIAEEKNQRLKRIEAIAKTIAKYCPITIAHADSVNEYVNRELEHALKEGE